MMPEAWKVDAADGKRREESGGGHKACSKALKGSMRERGCPQHGVLVVSELPLGLPA